jgi:hypothetical protein
MRVLEQLCIVALIASFSTNAPAQEATSCPITVAPATPFVPPAAYTAAVGPNSFLIGTRELWTQVHHPWHPLDGNKIPFFREGFNWMTEPDPRLTVVARRLDVTAPLRWSGWANSGGPSGRLEDLARLSRTVEGGFMVTAVGELEPGCWEIAARYAAARGDIRTLSFVVEVKPESDVAR